jgi:DNA polymerase III delta subunit
VSALPNPLPASRFGDALAAGLPPVVVLAGSERWFREDALARIVSVTLPDGDVGGAFLRYDARRAEDREGVSAAVDDLRSRGLFGGGKVVAVENPASASGPWASGGRASPITRLAKAALDPPPDAGSVLVLLSARPVKGRDAVPTKTLVGAGALVVDCRALYDAPGPWQRGAAPHDHELARHVARRLQEVHGKRMALVEAHALTRMVGSDLGAIEDALRSLALYLGEEDTVTTDTLAAVLGDTRTDPAWALLDAVFDRKGGEALDLLSQARARGLADGRGGVIRGDEALFAYLGAALHGQFRKVLRGAEALQEGTEPSSIAREAGIPSFKAESFLARCRRDPRKLRDLHAAFFEAETGLKSGRLPAGLALERLVLALVRA